MTTIAEISEITGIKEIDFVEDGKWLIEDQKGSKGLMNERIAKLKAQGIPAFFNARERVWGVLASEVQI